jgi:hypothetical protein
MTMSPLTHLSSSPSSPSFSFLSIYYLPTELQAVDKQRRSSAQPRRSFGQKHGGERVGELRRPSSTSSPASMSGVAALPTPTDRCRPP